MILPTTSDRGELATLALILGETCIILGLHLGERAGPPGRRTENDHAMIQRSIDNARGCLHILHEFAKDDPEADFGDMCDHLVGLIEAGTTPPEEGQ